MPEIEVWRQFDHDPRRPANARMRASDRDRAVIETVLADAFAEGRLTREEYDERTGTALASRTLGELVPLISDLAVGPTPRTGSGDLRDQAVRRWQAERREALLGLIGLSALLWTIWAVTMWGGFPWPLFPMGFALMNLVRIVVNKNDIIEEHARKLEKKQRRELQQGDDEA